MERGIQIQEEVDKDTGGVCSGDNNGVDHVKQRQKKERDNDNSHDHRIRNRIESRTHDIILVKTKEDGGKLWEPNEAKYDRKDNVLAEEYRWILHAEKDERFVKGWFCV